MCASFGPDKVSAGAVHTGANQPPEHAVIWVPASAGITAVGLISSDPALTQANTTLYHEVRRRHSRTRRSKPVEEIIDETDETQTQAPPFPVKRPVFPGEKPRGSPSRDIANTEYETPVKPSTPLGPPPPPEVWTAAEIEQGRASCEKQLPITDFVFDLVAPIKEGACGLPAPIRLTAFQNERGPPLELKPAATMSCKMAAALRRWVDEIVQREAKARLDATIIRMSNASAYVCRTRYDDPTQRISQHAYGNAFDVSEFVTAKGEVISVLDHWNAGDERAAFVRAVHAGACEIFGTTLGPEANEAHKNHFHFDMAERRRGICDFVPGQQARKQKPEPKAVELEPEKQRMEASPQPEKPTQRQPRPKADTSTGAIRPAYR